MISWINNLIENIIEFQIRDRQHNKWIRLIKKYYKNMLHDSENADIHLSKLLDYCDINPKDAKDLSENIIKTDMEFIGPDDDNFENRYNEIITYEYQDFFTKIKTVVKECFKELGKYGNSLIDRKF